MIQPIYLELNELHEDCLDLIEEYLNGLDIESYSLDELIKLCPVLIDVFNLTHSKLPKNERDPLEYRVYTMSVSLMSEVFNTLHSLKDDPVSSNSVYSSTIRALSKLKRTVDLFKIEDSTISLDPELSESVYFTLGLKNESE